MTSWPPGWSAEDRHGTRTPHTTPVAGPPRHVGDGPPPEAPPRSGPDSYADAYHPGTAPQPVAYGPPGTYRADAYGPDTYQPDAYQPEMYRTPPPAPPTRRTGKGVRRRPRPRRWGRRVLTVALCALLASGAGTLVWADTRLNRTVDLTAVPGRATLPGKGTNYLIVGSDSRSGLSQRARKDLHTGSAEGRRTDSMILLHTGAHGATMMSLPRDSWVTVPRYLRTQTGKRYGPAPNKLNAAFAIGGPELLVRTVEHNTRLRIDHYAEVGFAGFVNIVDSVGGVRMCLERDIRDKKSGTDLRRGCQRLNGAQSLAFVRQRHQEADGDLGRTRNQQRLLSALAQQAAAPGTMLDPSKLYTTAGAGLDTLIVDKDMSLHTLTSLFRAMESVAGGTGRRINVPVTGRGLQTDKGSAVQWDTRRAERLFAELREDRPVTTSR